MSYAEDLIKKEEYLREMEWYIDELEKICEGYGVELEREESDYEIVLRFPR